ncbi:hypothetical protein AMS68_003703 [Peltaster fructicola]|uniref:GRF-type domain-containing protein n=1 Tax=Peltaster fructicola TaxID=286661 RepID=A0A6H0XU31_9PEZI|nr:hypothetical protein AMS68_003703 [Peltaster fructicola]
MAPFVRRGRGGGYNNYQGSTRKKAASKTPAGSFHDDAWHCGCDLKAVRRQVKKENENKDRWFYVCPQSSHDKQCGFFKWMEDAQPSKPQSETVQRFQVKKDNENRGKWFLTCQQEDDKQCGFWLWETEAQRRAGGALLSNSRTESRIENQQETATSATISAARSHHDQSYDPDDSTDTEPPLSPSRRKSRVPHTNGTKRTATMADLDEHDEYKPPETPVKDMQNRNLAYATPATTTKKRVLPWAREDDGAIPAQPQLKKPRIVELPTPQTPRFGDKWSSLLTEEVVTPIRAPSAASISYEVASTPTVAAVTPTQPEPPAPPSRYRDALEDPDVSNSSLVKKVLLELAGVYVPEANMANLRSILSTYELNMKGIQMGRDDCRALLVKRNQEIEDLQNKNQSLENRLSHQKLLSTPNKAAELRR